MSFFQPPSTTPGTTTHDTTIPNSHRRLPTNMAHDHQWQCGNATSLATTTRTNNPKRRRKPKNERKQPHHSQMMASTYKWTQATTSRGETACLPPIDFSDSISRCHITVSDVATRRQMMMSFVVVVRTPQ